MKYLFIELGSRRLGGGSHCNYAIADILKEAGNTIVYYDITSYLPSIFPKEEIADYYPLRYMNSSDIIEGSEPFDGDVYHAYHNVLPLSENLIKLGNEADVVFAGVDYLNHSLAVTFPGKFISYLHCAPVPINAPLINEAKLVISNSHHTRDALYERCGVTYSPVINPPVDPSYYNSSIPLKDRKFDVVFFGRIAPDKIGSFDFESFSWFMKSDNISANIIGSYWAGDFRYKTDINVISNAKFNVIKDILSNTKIYIHTKREEDFGMSILEAVCSGCVALVPDSSWGFEDIPGVLKYSSYDDLIWKVCRILNDPEYYDKARMPKVDQCQYLYNRTKERVLNLIK